MNSNSFEFQKKNINGILINIGSLKGHKDRTQVREYVGTNNFSINIKLFYLNHTTLLSKSTTSSWVSNVLSADSYDTIGTICRAVSHNHIT